MVSVTSVENCLDAWGQIFNIVFTYSNIVENCLHIHIHPAKSIPKSLNYLFNSDSSVVNVYRRAGARIVSSTYSSGSVNESPALHFGNPQPSLFLRFTIILFVPIFPFSCAKNS